MRFPFLLLISILTILAPDESNATAPTIPASNITFNFIDGGSMRVQWANGDGARRIVVARLATTPAVGPMDGVDYIASSTFGNGNETGPGNFVIYDNTGFIIDLNGLSGQTEYAFTVYEYNGTNANTEYLIPGTTANQSTASPPTIQSSNIISSNVDGNSMTLSWDNGDGNGRIVLAREGAPVSVNPVDLNFYSANPNFGNGFGFGNDTYVVFSGTQSSVSVQNLEPNTEYHFAIFEFNGSSTPVHLIPGATFSQTTAGAPTIPATNIGFNFVDGSTMRVNWASGNGQRRLLIGRAGGAVDALPVDGQDYTSSATFGNGDEIGTGNFALYNNSFSLVDLSNLLPNTEYHFTVVEYNGTGSNTVYLNGNVTLGSSFTATTPATPASNLSFVQVTGSQMTINWNAGDGSGRLVAIKEGSASTAVPTDLTFYNTNPSFGIGANIGDTTFAVYRGTASSTTVTNLQPNTTYFVYIFEYNGNSSPVYLSPGALATNITAGAPTQSASNLSFNFIDGGTMRLNWTSGNGSRRIVVASDQGPINATPTDGVDYTSSATYGNGDDLGNGQYILYDNSSSFADINGLLGNTEYHFAIFEYNGTGNNTIYQTNQFLADSSFTATTPVVQTSNITFSNVTGNSMQINWTNGDGARRILLMKAGSSINVAPIDLTLYGSSTFFGSGNNLGDDTYAIYTSSGTSVTVQNLNPNTTYFVQSFEYNGTSTPVYLTPGATANQTTVGAPTLPASNFFEQFVDGATMRINWSSGNGSQRLVVASDQGPVSQIPTDGISYSASQTFGNGDDLGNGTFVVYNNAGGFVDLNGLQGNTFYHFGIFEYNGQGANTIYLTAPFLSDSAFSAQTPTIQTSGFQFSNVTTNSMNISWTNGDGQGRLVVARQGQPVTFEPTDLINYSSSSTFGNSPDLGNGQHVVYKGVGSSFTLNDLLQDSIYYFSVFEYNGSSTPVYLTPAANTDRALIADPTLQATNLQINVTNQGVASLDWINGDGNSRILLVREGGSVDVDPVDGEIYTPNSAFGSGGQLGNGNFVVYVGNNNMAQVSNLQGGATYHFAIYEANILGSTSSYFENNPARNLITMPTLTICFADVDGDGFGNVNASQSFLGNCINGFVTDSTDCDDQNADINPNVTEICDGLDNNCDNILPTNEMDDDGDGIINCLDGCPLDSLKTDPGNCGCGNPEPGTVCDDGNAFTVNDTIDLACNCVGTSIQCIDDVDCDDNDLCTTESCDGNGNCIYTVVSDTDNDGVCDAIDDCPLDSLKTDPGNCGCGNPEPGTVCDDGNAFTVNDTIDLACNCVGTSIQCIDDVDCNDNDPCTTESCDGNGNCLYTVVSDTDNDGVCDAIDGCPLDSLKTDPGNCGCGNPEPETSCDDGNPSTTNDVINNNCDCEGQSMGDEPAAVCNNAFVYINIFDPDYHGSGFQWVYNLEAELFDGGSTYSGENTIFEIKRVGSFVPFEWTTQGACVDESPNGVYNFKDQGKLWRSCYPATLFDVWRRRKYRLRISDENGSDICTAKVLFLMTPSFGSTAMVNSVHLVQSVSEQITTNSHNISEDESSSIIAKRSFEKQLNMDIQLFPNPTNDLLNLRWNNAVSQPVNIIVGDLFGHVLHKQSYQSGIGENKIILDVSHFHPGMYSITLTFDGQSIVKKWIKSSD